MKPPFEPGTSSPDNTLETRVQRLEQEVARLNLLLEQSSASSAPQRQPPPPPPPPSFAAISAAAPAPEDTLSTPPRASIEDRLGAQWFNRIGIILLLLGASWFLKLAIDRGWIGPAPRVIFGLLAGSALVLWSERFRHRGFAPFSYSLKALGSGVLYLSLWAAFRLYGLLPASVALVLMIAVTGWNAFMAWVQGAELLAAYALAGGLATPALLSTGGNHEIFLFTYLLVLDIATIALVRLRPWPRLLPGVFAATAGYFVAWYLQHFAASELAITSLYIALFGAAFASVPLHPSADQPEPTHNATLRDVLLPLANAAFVALAFYSVLEDTGHHDSLPWMVLALAVVYLALLRIRQTRVASAIHLSIAVVLLTIAIPLKASGYWITAGWLVEGLALVWVNTRVHLAEPSISRVLRWLAEGALALGVSAAMIHLFPLLSRTNETLWNSDIATALLGLAVLAAAAALALHQPATEARDRFVAAAVIAFNLLALFAGVREVAAIWPALSPADQDAALKQGLAISGFLMLYGAALLAAGFTRRNAFLRWQGLILLLFTILKTFLYDMRDLSQGYRVASFLALGALLMAISFAYQRDWLALRAHQPPPPPQEAQR